MRVKLLNKIEELKQNAPNDWVKQCANKMKLSEDMIRKIANGKTSDRNFDRLIELIEILKQINIEFSNKIEEVLQ